MKLEELRITDSAVPAIGHHSFWGLKSLRILDLSSNNISALSETNFRTLDSLRELNLDDNVIRSIPSATFRYLVMLQKLRLARNMINQLVSRQFFGLKRLEFLDLGGNQLGDLDADVFKDIRRLKTLQLRDTGLTYINRYLLYILPELENLDLGENQLKYLEKGIFSETKRLKNLNLDSNFLTVLTSGMFQGLNLHALELQNNRIIKLGPDTFHNTTVKTLNLGYNRLEDLEANIFVPLKNLSELVLSGNRIEVKILWQEVVGPRSGLELRRLHLADCNLGKDYFLSEDFFTIQPGLRGLNLSGNFFHEFPIKLISPLEQLNFLDLSRNSIQGINSNATSLLHKMRNLKKLYIHSNPWRCEACQIQDLLLYIQGSSTIRPLCENDTESIVCPKCNSPYNMSGTPLIALSIAALPNCLANSVAEIDPIIKGEEVKLFQASGMTQKIVVILALSTGCGLLILAGACILAFSLSSRRHRAVYYTHEESKSNISEKTNAYFENDREISEMEVKMKLLDINEIMRSAMKKGAAKNQPKTKTIGVTANHRLNEYI